VGRTAGAAAGLADPVRPRAHRVRGPRMLPGVKLSILTPAYRESATLPSLERCFKLMPLRHRFAACRA
jgi:hypothetical protein